MKSRQNERNLVHALKNPKSFTVARLVPTFPQDPVVLERNMSISQNFHMSQVHGARKRKKALVCDSARRRPSLGTWKLTPAQDCQRMLALGHLCNLRVADIDEIVLNFSDKLRRRLQSARVLGFSRCDGASRERYQIGRTSQLLRMFEYSCLSDYSLRPKSSRFVKAPKEGSILDAFFPLTRHIEDGSVLSTASNCNFENASIRQTEAPAADGMCQGVTGFLHTVSREVPNLQKVSVELTKLSGARMMQRNPDEVKETFSHSQKSQIFAQYPDAQQENTPFIATARTSLGEKQGAALSYMNSDLSAFATTAASSNIDDHRKLALENNTAPEDEFRLPSQCETSDDSESEDEAGTRADLNVDNFRLPTPESSDDEEDKDYETGRVFLCCDDQDAVVADSFRLPTPESSSDEEGSEDQDQVHLKVCNRDDVQSSFGITYGSSLPADNNAIGHLVDVKDVSRDYSFKSYQPDAPNGSLLLNRKKTSKSILATEDATDDCPTQNDSLFVCGSVPESNIRECDSTKEARRSLCGSVCAEEKKIADTLADTPDSDVPALRKKRCRAARALEDTPDSCHQSRPSVAGKSICASLSNTQKEEVRRDDFVCSVCQSQEFSEADPIIFCDGPGKEVSCNLAVHLTCYDAVVDLKSEADWYCDVCEYFRNGGDSAAILCHGCNRRDGVLKRLPCGQWKHIRCIHTGRTKILKRLRQRPMLNETEKPRQVPMSRPPLLDLSRNQDTGSVNDYDRKMKRRKAVCQKYIDDEALDSGDDDDEEERNALEIEEEEKEFSSFINDSSQLGLTQDELDRVEPSERNNSLHRALDIEHERKHQFDTPRLNRLICNADRSPYLGTQSSGPESIRDLGKMHFIRSVLVHHRNGGSAEDIENFYRDMEINNDTIDETEEDE
jgi:PHD-finger